MSVFSKHVRQKLSYEQLLEGIELKFFIFLFLLFTSTASFSQERQVIRHAEQSDFVGYWRVFLIPDEKRLHPNVFNKDVGFAGSCRFVVHKPDGAWFNVTINNGSGEEETKLRCPSISTKDIDQAVISTNLLSPSQIKWTKLQTPLFAVENLSSKNRVIWIADYVTEDTSDYVTDGVSIANFFDFKKGDLIMDRAVPIGQGQIKAVWRMVLRPVLDQSPRSYPAVSTDAAR